MLGFFFLCLKVGIECIRSLYFALIGRKKKKCISGETVLITGAGNGLGRALAFEYAKHGVKLALLDIDKEGNETTADEINSQIENATATAYHCDVTNTDDVKKVARRVKQDIGQVDIVVNNAGILSCVSFLKLSEHQIRKTFEVNLLSHFWILHEFLPDMLNANHGHIVEICSMAGWAGVANLTDYGSSKFGVRGLCYSLQAEIDQAGRDGINISCVCPMWLNTNMLSTIQVETSSNIIPPILQAPEDTANIIVNKMLQNDFMICIPASMQLSTRLERILPYKVVKLLDQYIGSRMYQKNSVN